MKLKKRFETFSPVQYCHPAEGSYIPGAYKRMVFLLLFPGRLMGLITGGDLQPEFCGIFKVSFSLG